MIHHVTITIIYLTNTTLILESSIASEERYDDWGESDDSDDSESTQQKMSQSESKEILTTEEVLKLRGGKL